MENFQMTHNVALPYGGFIKLVKEHVFSTLFYFRTENFVVISNVKKLHWVFKKRARHLI